MSTLAPGLGMLALLAAVALAPLGIIGLRERASRRGATFAALMFCLAGWATSAGVHLLAPGNASFLDILLLAGLAAWPVLWLQFNLTFAERGNWLKQPQLAILWLCAALFVALALADSRLIGGADSGPGWHALSGLAYGVYSLTLGAAGLTVLLGYALAAPRLRRAQAIVLLAAASAPLIATTAHLFDFGPRAGAQIAAQALLASALVLWYGVLRFHLMIVPPLVHRMIFENMADAVLVVDRWDNLVEANPAAMTLFAIGDDDLSLPFASAIRWPELAIERRQAGRHEIVRAGAAGSEWYEVSVLLLPTARPVQAGSVLQIRNISEARRARLQIEDSEAFYRSVVERQGEGIVLFDAADILTYANPAAETILRVEPGSLAGRSIYDFFTASQAEALEIVNANRAQQITATYEIPVTCGDGAEHILLATVTPDRRTTPPGTFAIFRDITEARQSERRSQQWRQRYELVAAISGQLIYYYDAATNTVEWGESVEQVFGYPRAEMTGGIIQWANLLHPADRLRVLTTLATAQDAYEDSYRLQHKQGHYLLVHTHILPLRDEASALQGYVGVVRDVSRQHRLQQAVLHHARRLEQLQALSLTLSSQRTLLDLYHTLVQGAVDLLKATAAVLYTVEAGRATLQRVATEPAHAAGAFGLHPSILLAQRVVVTQQLQRQDDPLAAGMEGASQLTSFRAARIGVPLLAETAVFAVLVVENSQHAAAFDAEDEQLLRLLANQAAAELANNRLLADTAMRAERLRLVNEITTAVIQVLDLDVVLQHIVDGLARVLGADAVRLALFDEAHQRLTVMAQYMPEGSARAVVAAEDVIGGHLLRLVLQTRTPTFVADAAADARTEDMRAQVARRSIAALAVIPVAAGEEVLGVIVAEFADKQHIANGEDDLRLGETLANLAAVRIQQVRLYTTLQRLSIVDELTQVYNFRALFEIGENEFARARRHQRPLAAIFLDIDHFRAFNTRYSHTVGNQVLRAVGRRLLTITRNSDLVARFGGEEFVVLLPETDAPLAATMAYRIHEELGKLQVATDHGPLHITVSVGVANRTPDMKTVQDLIDRANQGENRAKAAGRNRVVIC